MKRYAALTCLLTALMVPPIAAADPQGVLTLDMRAGRPVVDGVFVNGHGPYRFLLDTGSTLNHIDPALAKTIGLSVTFRTRLTSSTGVVDAEGNDTGDVRLGSAAADQQVFLFTGMEGLHEISRDIQGVLGQVFLARFDYLLDLRARRMEFGAAGRTAQGTRLPFRTAEGRPVVSTSLGSLVLDTGASTMIRFHVDGGDNTQQMATATGIVAVATVSSRLVIDGRTFWRGEAIAVPQSPEKDADGLLPISPFKSIYVSNSEGFVVLD